jgi:hypothetical protein
MLVATLDRMRVSRSKAGRRVVAMMTRRIEETIMKGRRLGTLLIALVTLMFTCPRHSFGQDGNVYWHIDPGVKTCSMVIDPSLTQAQWKIFVEQAGALVSFKSLAPAEPLGRWHFALGLDYAVTPVDQHDPAWINTFTHPDADCPLGDQIKMPAVRARLGVSSRMDVIGFWTTAPRANYGLVGGALEYAFLRESARVPAAAVIASYTGLTGVPDFDMSIYSVAAVASKRMGAYAPYLGVKQSIAVGTETTTKVDLARETVPLGHAFVGVTGSLWRVGVAAEYEVASVNTFSLMIGYHR